MQIFDSDIKNQEMLLIQQELENINYNYEVHYLEIRPLTFLVYNVGWDRTLKYLSMFKTLDMHIDRMTKIKDAISTNTKLPPVFISLVKENSFYFDGLHRMAVCLELFGNDLQPVVVFTPLNYNINAFISKLVQLDNKLELLNKEELWRTI